VISSLNNVIIGDDCYKIVERGRKGMENPRIMKGFGVIILLLFLSTTCIPVLASEGKPDLIVSMIGYGPKDIHYPSRYYAVVENIGNATLWNKEYTLLYVFTRMVFKKIPITVLHDYTWCYLSRLAPGEQLDFELMVEPRDLPKFGYFEYKCIINPNKSLEESNYGNNDLSQDYFVFLGHWKAIG